MILFSKRNCSNSKDSCVVNPSLIRIRGLAFARSRVEGSNTFRIQSRLISLFTYPVLERPKCQPSVGWTVHVLRCVKAGHTIRGSSDLPLAEIHSTAVIMVR